SNGARLVDFQHGGAYGVYLAVPAEDISLEKEVFYTWGWDSREGFRKRLKKLPSPHLSRLRDSYSFGINKILYIGTGLPRYHYRFHVSSLPEEFVQYLEDMKIFLQNLPVELKYSLLYRPYPHEYGWNIKKIVKEVCPQAELLEDVGTMSRLTDCMQKVRLCVIDHSHTSYIEALAINVPSIFFWNHDIHVMRPEAEEYFELLRRAGILHKNPKGAMAKLVEVFNDPWTWWKSEAVQEARNTFLERFGYSRKDWMDYWAEEIRTLAKGL
ncbi:MAG: LIC12162 family transferase, partial [Candidatus Brocadiales bacterium]